MIIPMKSQMWLLGQQLQQKNSKTDSMKLFMILHEANSTLAISSQLGSGGGSVVWCLSTELTSQVRILVPLVRFVSFNTFLTAPSLDIGLSFLSFSVNLSLSGEISSVNTDPWSYFFSSSWVNGKFCKVNKRTLINLTRHKYKFCLLWFQRKSKLPFFFLVAKIQLSTRASSVQMVQWTWTMALSLGK